MNWEIHYEEWVGWRKFHSKQDWYTGGALASQASETGSIPVSCSTDNCEHEW